MCHVFSVRYVRVESVMNGDMLALNRQLQSHLERQAFMAHHEAR